jgi:hypothetical protein
MNKTQRLTTYIKQSGSSGFATVRHASGLVTGDTDAATQSASYHIRNRSTQWFCLCKINNISFSINNLIPLFSEVVVL